jgi:hypothetical protein
MHSDQLEQSSQPEISNHIENILTILNYEQIDYSEQVELNIPVRLNNQTSSNILIGLATISFDVISARFPSDAAGVAVRAQPANDC